MSAKQKIFACKATNNATYTSFAEQLNLEAEQGWRVQSCSTKVDMSGSTSKETKADTHLFILEESPVKYQYICKAIHSHPTISVDSLNAALEEQAVAGWRLIVILHSWAVKGRDQIGLQTEQRYFLVFEKEVGS